MAAIGSMRAAFTAGAGYLGVFALVITGIGLYGTARLYDGAAYWRNDGLVLLGSARPSPLRCLKLQIVLKRQ
jgi:hypothetical protein